MIFRAAFFIGLVCVLAPREPDLGLGRPGAGALLPSPASVLSAVGLSHLGQGCTTCAGGLGSLPRTDIALPQGRTLSDVKAEIRAAIKARREARG
jgi:hypothetical protein